MSGCVGVHECGCDRSGSWYRLDFAAPAAYDANENWKGEESFEEGEDTVGLWKPL